MDNLEFKNAALQFVDSYKHLMSLAKDSMREANNDGAEWDIDGLMMDFNNDLKDFKTLLDNIPSSNCPRCDDRPMGLFRDD